MVNVVHTPEHCSTKVLPLIMPEEVWSRRGPWITHMRVFRCIAYAMVPDEKRGKFDTKGTKCLFLGYFEGTKVYRLMCIETKKIIENRDVVFMDDITKCW